MPSLGAYELGREDAELCETCDQRASEGGCGECGPPAVEVDALDMRLGCKCEGEDAGW
jgi:hypothetical protein